MEYYEYKSKDVSSGKVITGVITADNIESAGETLKRRGEVVLEIGEMRDFMDLRKNIYRLSTRVKKKTKAEFFEMIRFMLESGMPLHEALTTVRDSGKNKSMRNLSDMAANEVRKGKSLSSALDATKKFDEAMIQQIKAGEESGNIAETLNRLVSQINRETEFSAKIKSAMIYPIVICVVMVVVLWVMLTFVVPSLAKTLTDLGGELPLITKIVIGTSNFMTKATPYIVLLVIGLVLVYKTAMKNDEFHLKSDTVKLKIPLVGKMLEKIELSRFCRNLSALQKSGIPLAGSLGIVEASVKNRRIRESVKKAKQLVEVSGMMLSNAMTRAGGFPDMMRQLIEVGINSGQVCTVLDKISLQYENEVDKDLKRLTSIAEPALIIFVGLVVSTIVLAIYLPIMSVTDFI